MSHNFALCAPKESAEDTSRPPLQNKGMQHKALQHKCIDQVSKRFSLAANRYDAYNLLQQRSADFLQAPLHTQGLLLDIGSGPGTDFHARHQGHVINLDIAEGMLKCAQKHYPTHWPLCADAQALPFLASSIDAIYSNLALQWCSSLSCALQEIHRVLTPSGECHLAIVADGSLLELKQLGLRVNPFMAAPQIEQIFTTLNWQQVQFEQVPMQVYFDDLKSLLYSIKGVGASAFVAGQNKTAMKLRGRQDWSHLTAKAENLRTHKGLSLTYQIAIMRAVK